MSSEDRCRISPTSIPGSPRNGSLPAPAAWASDLRGFAIDSGHYLAEEAPRETARVLLDFFTA
jgi:haloacetate dehalogenase